MNEPVPLILTKLQPPLLRRHISPRERLSALVRQAAERRVTLVCAGPGYGKTTLIASSLLDAGAPVIWYSLSRSDRDFTTFLAYLTEAFERQWPGFGDRARPAALPAGAHKSMRPAAFAAACVNQLAATDTGEFLLVMDDFQLVDRVPEICQTLDLLICHAPPKAHFVIATRTAPAIACLPRLRAEGLAVEITEADLKFTPEEVRALYARCLNLTLSDQATVSLAEQIEGWVLGLLMAGQSLKSGGRAAAAESMPQLTTDRGVLFDYLSEEVMRQQPADLVDFLLSSAVLSRLEPLACDQALGRSDSAAQLQRLEQQCLFVVRTEDGYLRYHRLFREFLLGCLAGDADRREALHRRAAAYFEAQENLDHAVYHRLEARDFPHAARLISSVLPEMLRAARFDTLRFWLGQLPEDALDEFPQLWAAWGQIGEAEGQWDQALQHYERAAQALTARGDLLKLSEVLHSKGRILDWRKGQYEAAERLHREALSYVGEMHRRQRAALLAGLARDQLSAGHTASAQALYREALAIYEAEADRQGQLDTLLNPGSWLFHSLGEFSQALAALRRAERLARDLDSPRQLAETYNNMAVNLYFLGRMPESLDCAHKALALSQALDDSHGQAFALMNQANGWEATCGAPFGELYRQYQSALHLQQALGNPRFVIATLVFMTVLGRRGGDAAEAARRGQQAAELAAQHRLPWLAGFARVQLGAAQIWADPDAARASLVEALRVFDECGDAYHITVSHFWLAALYQSEDQPLYLTHLRECLRLAVGHQYDHLFHGEAQAAIPLLAAAVEHNLWPAYVTPVLARLGADAAGSLRPLLAHPDPAARRRAQAALEAVRDRQPVSGARASEPPAVPPLTIHLLGNFAVWRDGRQIGERDWGRRKSKRLFKYIVLSPGHKLSKDAAIERLWANAEPQAANANFYRALYNLRRVLEPLSPHSGTNYLALEGGFVRLTAGAAHSVDVDEFTRLAEAGHRQARIGDPAAAWRHLAAAIRLYTGDLSTDDLYDDWLAPRRDQLRDLYLRALCDLAELAADARQVDLALHHLRPAFRQDRASEALCRSLMLCLAKAGERAEALHHYAACEEALAELDLSPSAELQAVHHELRAL